MIIHFEYSGDVCTKACELWFKGWGHRRAKLTFHSTSFVVISHFDWQHLCKCSGLFGSLLPHACSTSLFFPAWKWCCDLFPRRLPTETGRRRDTCTVFCQGTKTRLGELYLVLSVWVFVLSHKHVSMSYSPSWPQQIRPPQQRKKRSLSLPSWWFQLKISRALFLTPITTPSSQTGPVNQHSLHA